MFKSRIESEDSDVFASVSLLRDLLEVLVDDCHGEHDTRAAANRTHHVRKDAQCADANATEHRRSVDVSAQVVNQRLLTQTSGDRHVLFLKLTADVLGGLTRDSDPDSAEQRAAAHHE